ncbi:cell division protein FtsQ/DivIB [Candidatus Finniella inopinata]|nr:cell division protein FtsQ/DivIB [Candidatus Finniella inopinata]
MAQPSRKGRQRQRQQWRRWFINASTITALIALPLGLWLGYPQLLLSFGESCFISGLGKCGFQIQEIFIEGREFIKPEVVGQAVNAKRGEPIFGHSLDDLKSRLEKIDWIKSVHIERQLPDQLYIKISERYPIAIWQHQKTLYLVDREGVVIQNAKLYQFQQLPLVIGPDAPLHTPKILTLLEKFPKILERVKVLTRVRQRRWDITFKDSILVKLSEQKPEESLARLSLLIEQGKIHKGDVSMVDLRNREQIVLRLSPEAAIRIKLKGKET